MHALFPTVWNLCCTAHKGTCQRVTMGFTLLVGLCKSFCKRFPLRILTCNLGWQNLTRWQWDRWQWTGQRALLAGRGQFSNKTSQASQAGISCWSDQTSQTVGICLTGLTIPQLYEYSAEPLDTLFDRITDDSSKKHGDVTLYNRSPFSNRIWGC